MSINKLPSIIGNNMILEKNAKIWGYSEPFGLISIEFIEKIYETSANSTGFWEVTFQNLPIGGPYEMYINDEKITNVMVGYVWLCGGQSNMQLSIERVRSKYHALLKDVNHPYIRQFKVREAFDFCDRNELFEGEWKEATAENIDEFSATGFFFANKLYEKYKVPIGIILSAYGGSSAQSWIREEALPFEKYKEELSIYKEKDYVKNTMERELTLINKWYDELDENDLGLKERWYEKDFDDTNWDKRNLTDEFNDELLTYGAIWFRKDFFIPDYLAYKPATLFLGTIVDSDYTYVNGQFVGRVEYRYPPRIYRIDQNVLVPGKNTIAIRVISSLNFGQFIKDKEYSMVFDDDKIDLNGMWHYKVSCVMDKIIEETTFRKVPSGFYNAMLYPIINYTIKGMLWYQGESNDNCPDEYYCLMKTLINDLRNGWGYEFPFIFVQLVNFITGLNDNWAKLRYQQSLCLDIPNTKMVVGIDVGEHNDLHPLNKRAIGERLALSAMKLAYNEDIICDGPMVNNAIHNEGKIILSFENAEKGLLFKDEYNCFEVSDKNGNIYEVQGDIDGSDVVISCPGVNEPLWVKYAWSDNPVAFLYNGEGIPASPFVYEVKY